MATHYYSTGGAEPPLRLAYATPASWEGQLQVSAARRPDEWAISSPEVSAYLKQIGLRAWIAHFETHLPANVKSVGLVRATTAADLQRMATKATYEGKRMRLDHRTIQQVLDSSMAHRSHICWGCDAFG